ncbi:MAG: hypothetical protein LBN08_04945 [Lactobacillales bacterium]|jgi:hypothetical protein|nr:hypothetical protein [Lactobacillales bacterium]
MLKKISKQQWITFGVFVAISLFVTWLAFAGGGMLQGDDLFFHEFRVLGLADSIKHLDFFPALNFLMAKGHAYAAPLFYSNFFIYIPAILCVIGLPFTASMAIFYTLANLLGLYIAYYVFKKLSDSNFGQVFAICYLVAGNHLTNFLGRAALGEYLAGLFFPLVFLGVERILNSEDTKNAWKPLFLGMSALVFAHVLSVFISAIYVALAILLNINKLNVAKILAFVKATVFTLAVSLCFIVPLAEQHGAQTLKVDTWKELNSVAERANGWIGEGSLLGSSFGSDVRPWGAPGLVFFAIFLTFAIISIFHLAKRNDILNPYEKYFVKIKANWQNIVIVLVFCVLGSNLFPWKLVEQTVLGTIQYPARVLMVPILILLFLGFSIIENMILIVVFAACAVIQLFVTMSAGNHQYVEAYYIDNIVQLEKDDDLPWQGGIPNGSIGWGQEYLNAVTDDYKYQDSVTARVAYMVDPQFEIGAKGTVASGDAKLSRQKVTYNNYTFNYTAKKDSKIVTPYIWYKGYEAFYKDGAKGGQPKLDLKKLGFASLNVKAGSGTVTVKYVGTTLQLATRIISIVSAAAIAIYWWFTTRKK